MKTLGRYYWYHSCHVSSTDYVPSNICKQPQSLLLGLCCHFQTQYPPEPLSSPGTCSSPGTYLGAHLGTPQLTLGAACLPFEAVPSGTRYGRPVLKGLHPECPARKVKLGKV